MPVCGSVNAVKSNLSLRLVGPNLFEFSISYVFNRPGVAGAVLQLPLSLIHLFN